MIGLMLLPFILLYSLIISYFCSVVIYRLCITKKYYNLFFAVLLYVASGISSFWFGFLFCPLFVWYFWRKKLKFLKITLIASVCIMCLSFWQAQLPQMVVFEIASKSLDKTDGMTEILNENFNPNKFTYGFSKELEDCREKNINCPFFSFKFPIYNIYDKVNGEKIIVAKEYGIAYSTSTLIRFLTSMVKTSRIVYHISKNENNILY
ncbi:hypothetical protein [Campylobacter magnus]|uniref:hypothetical protein n=1 Tax=Campylobacter magnus TaxID=3026462 RepID=UPI0026E06E87|nr:hypothetical protein [Campylobacter magnus]MDO2407553.1 hypothetical protein [Campylobacter magnus]